MATLKRAPKPDPTALYEAIQPFTAPVGTFRAGTRLRGDHDVVRAHFGSFMLADLPDNEKGRIRSKAIWGHGEVAEHNPAGSSTHRQATLRGFRAIRSWTLADPDLQHRGLINAGELVDADDEVFRRYPHLFVQHVEDRWR